VVAANARLTKGQAQRLAIMAQDGLGVRPSSRCIPMFDGDAVFCLSTGTLEADTSAVGALAARSWPVPWPQESAPPKAFTACRA